MGSPQRRAEPVHEDEDEDVVTITGRLSSVSRTGSWRVPKLLRLHRRGGSTQLGLTEAEVSYGGVRIELDVVAGSIEMRVPAGLSVNLDGLAVSLGSAEDHRRNPPTRGEPHIDIVGDLRWGSLDVRGPKRGPFQRFRA